MAQLRYLAPDRQQVYKLGKTFTLGRDELNDLSLPEDQLVSREHARIRRVGSAFVLEDLDSTNSTFVVRGGETLKVTTPLHLQADDLIRIGSARLIFETRRRSVTSTVMEEHGWDPQRTVSREPRGA